jgi:hypothetical protein
LPHSCVQSQQRVPARQFPQPASRHVIAFSHGNDIVLIPGNDIAVGCGKFITVTFGHDVWHFEPGCRGMLFPNLAGHYFDEVQLSGTSDWDNRRDKRNPE